MKRRDFIRLAGVTGTFVLLKPAALLESKSGTPIGIQLWSVRDAMFKDAKGTLKAIAGQGYKFVEGFGYRDGGWFGLPKKEFKMVLKDLGLKMPSCHHVVTNKSWDSGTRQLNDEFKRVVEAGNLVGQKYLINPWMDASERNLDSVKQLCDIMNEAGAYCKKHGIKFGYHNHAFEFDIKFGDKTMYQFILENTDPKLVKMEMDMGWVSRAGHKPLDWFVKAPGRYHLSHMKDMVGTDQDTSTIIGNGIVDFKNIIENKKLAGMKYWIVELEHYKAGSVQDAGVCYTNLRKLLV